MKFLIFSLTLFITSYVFGSGSDIYVCTDDTGHKTFSEFQCSNDQLSKIKRINSYPVSKKTNSRETKNKNSNVNNLNLDNKTKILEKYRERLELRLIKIKDDERKDIEKVKGYEVKSGQTFTAKELMNSSNYKKNKRIQAKYKRQRDAIHKKLESVYKDLSEIRKLQSKGN